MHSHVVIIGGGHSGGMAAILLRQNKYQGKITIVGEEKFYPYQRPQLSKGFLSRKVKENSLYLKTKEYYSKNNIDFILGNTVCEIIKDKKCLILDNKRKIYFEYLIIATGSLVQKIQGLDKKNDVYYLRDINDSRKLSTLINTNTSIGIIGSGYIGLEVAAIAAEKGLNVYITEIAGQIMKRLDSIEISNVLLRKHQDHGVNFYLNNPLLDITQNKKKQILATKKKNIEVDFIAVGIGVKPNDTLAKNSGIKCQDGIIVDEYCQTSADNIFAIGDCANHYNNIYNRYLRLESVHNAVEQARTVAKYISGKNEPYNQAPWFWTDQYNLKIQIVGLANDYNKTIIRGSAKKESFTIFYFKDEKLIASYSINRMKDFLTSKKLIEKGKNLPVDSFESEDFNLKSII